MGRSILCLDLVGKNTYEEAARQLAAWARMAFGFPNGVWQLVRQQTPASMFEEELGLKEEEVDNVVQKREGGSQARASTPGGSWRSQQGHSWGSSSCSRHW